MNFLVPQWRLCRWPSVSTHYKTALSSQHPALIVFINKLNSGPFLFQPKWVPLQFLTRTQSNQTNGMIYTSRSLVLSLIRRMHEHTTCCFNMSSKDSYFFTGINVAVDTTWCVCSWSKKWELKSKFRFVLCRLVLSQWGKIYCISYPSTVQFLIRQILIL